MDNNNINSIEYDGDEFDQGIDTTTPNDFPASFIRVSESLIRAMDDKGNHIYGLSGASIFGKIWSLALNPHNKHNRSEAGIPYLSKSLGLSQSTVSRKLKTLQGLNQDGSINPDLPALIVDVTPEEYKSATQVRFYTPDVDLYKEWNNQQIEGNKKTDKKIKAESKKVNEILAEKRRIRKEELNTTVKMNVQSVQNDGNYRQNDGSYSQNDGIYLQNDGSATIKMNPLSVQNEGDYRQNDGDYLQNEPQRDKLINKLTDKFNRQVEDINNQTKEETKNKQENKRNSGFTRIFNPILDSSSDSFCVDDLPESLKLTAQMVTENNISDDDFDW